MIHRSRETRLFPEMRGEIKSFYLPKYSPSLTEVEGRINRRLKRNICTNHNYDRIDDLEEATRRYMRKIHSYHKQSDLT